MKNKYKHHKLLAVYLFPYFYFAMWRDITHRLVWPYIAVIAWLLILRIYLGKIGKGITAVAGLAITLVLSALCIVVLHNNLLYKWSAYFGAFFPLPVITVIIAIEIFVLMNKDKQKERR